MAEGSWPKSDGGIFYASEANNMCRIGTSGITTPAAGSWNIFSPDNLGNTIDYDWTTQAGSGFVTGSNAAAPTAYIKFDLGQDRTWNTSQISYEVGNSTAGISAKGYYAVSSDDSTYRNMGSFGNIVTGSRSPVSVEVNFNHTGSELTPFRYAKIGADINNGTASGGILYQLINYHVY